jgi:SWI/SNF-related matrix-associated actin-dependent regulator 1 of chromatin subfamily A
MVGRVAITGRVIAVQPRGEERFVVTLGPPPDMFWWFCEGKPPKLGEKVRVTGERGERQVIDAGKTARSNTVIRQATWELIAEPYPVRVVSGAWLQRVQSVMERPLYRYQVEGAAWLSERLAKGHGSLLCDDPGLGKTAQTVSALATTGAFPALIVCPASLKEQWAREFLWLRRPPDVAVIDGLRGGIPFAEVHVLNYALLKSRARQLYQLKPRVIVFDEAHYLKEPRPGKRHRAHIATELAHAVGPVIALTGSPVLNRPQELWRLLHIVDRREWPDFDEFRYRYCGVRPHKGRPSKAERERQAKGVVTKVGKAERLNELAAKVQPLMLRRLKHQVLSDLPDKQRRVIPVQLARNELAHYKAAEKDVVAWLRYIGQGLRATKALRSKALTRLTYLRRIAALAKMRTVVPKYLRMWFDRGVPEPLVIFGYHRDVMLGIWEICRRLKLRVSGIGGKESSQKRQAAVDAFMSGWSDVFLAPIMCAGYGLNLQRASEALFVERVWSSAVLEQAEDRIHRLGQLRPVTITYLDAVGTVDEYVRNILTAKAKLVRAVVDGQVDTEAAVRTAELMLKSPPDRR